MPVSTAPPAAGRPFRVEIVLHPGKKAKGQAQSVQKPGLSVTPKGIVVPKTDPG